MPKSDKSTKPEAVDTGLAAADAELDASVEAVMAPPKTIYFPDPIGPENNTQVGPEQLAEIARDLAAKQEAPAQRQDQYPPEMQTSAPAPQQQPQSIPQPRGLSDAEAKELARLKALDDQARDFTARVMAARTPVPAVNAPQPVPERIALQTMAEMNAGRKMNEHHAALRAMAPQRKPEPTDGKNTPVFRPEQYDEYKSSLKSPAQTVSKDAIRQPHG